MAVRFCDGFDRYANTTDLTDLGWETDDSTNITLSTTGSNWGGKCLNIGDIVVASTGTFPGISKPLNSKPTGTILRMAFWIRTFAAQVFADGLTGGDSLFMISKGHYDGTGSADNISSMINLAGAINIYRFDEVTGGTRSLAGTGTIAINDGNWHHWEMEFTVGIAAGSIKTWVDGVADINTGAIDTWDQSAAPIDLSWLNTLKLSGGKRNPGATDFVRFDDVIIWDDDATDSENTMTGMLTNHTHRIETKSASSDASSSQFSRSTGASNAANVDDFDDGDTTYNFSTTDAHKDLFNMSSSSVFADIVFAVNVCAISRKTSGSNGMPKVRAIALNVATTRTAAQKPVQNTSYLVHEFPMSKDPNGGIAWTHNTLQTTTFGYERKTN